MKPAPKFLDELDRYWQPIKKENWQDKIDKAHKGQTGFCKEIENTQKQEKMKNENFKLTAKIQIQHAETLPFKNLDEEIKFRKVYATMLRTNCQSKEDQKAIEQFEYETYLKEKIK